VLPGAAPAEHNPALVDIFEPPSVVLSASWIWGARLVATIKIFRLEIKFDFMPSSEPVGLC
jgi:hypothetical protein